MNIKKNLLNLYEKGFKREKEKFQRLYPNEELCRFMGRNYLHLNEKARKKIKFLEVGVGSGGNLSMIANEGFKSYGIDFSKNSIKICKNIFNKKKLNADFKVANMISLPFKSYSFNALIDVFSSCLLTKKDGNIFLKEASRVLKLGGRFFSYFPSKKSNMFKSNKKVMHDADTIIKLNQRKTVYEINDYPLRFLTKQQYINLCKKNNLKVYYAEELKKTYFNGRDSFTFIIIEAIKI